MNTLEELRQKIDQTDNQILQLLADRINLVRQVGEYKKQNGIPVVDTSREDVVVQQKVEKGKVLNLSADFIKKIWQLFFEEAYKNEE